jgi:hypothetical protein
MSSFFILGTQRSGTTLLRLILNSHSKIAIPEDSDFLRPILKRKFTEKPLKGNSLKNLIVYLKKNQHFKLWNYNPSDFFKYLEGRREISLKEFIESLYSSYNHHEGKTIWGDKTPSLFRKLDIISSLFPEAKFIHIVRDGRDTFDSWRRMDPLKNNASVVALEWRYKIWKIDNFLQKIPSANKVTIKYEDLIVEPGKVLKKICKVIDVEYEEEMLNFYKKSERYIGKHHSKLIFKPLFSKNLEKWKKNLNKREIEVFKLLAGRYLRKYNYELQGSISFGSIVNAIFNILYGLPKRLFNVTKTTLLFEKAFAGKRVKFEVGMKPESKTHLRK